MDLLQGATELFPVSSLGHSVIIPTLLHWAFQQSDPTFVPFLVLLHLGTAGALPALLRAEGIPDVPALFAPAPRARPPPHPRRVPIRLLSALTPAAPLRHRFANPLQAPS